jgi:hypothetical protein
LPYPLPLVMGDSSHADPLDERLDRRIHRGPRRRDRLLFETGDEPK